MADKKTSEEWVERSEPDSLGWVKESHPSYGMLGISRASGHSALFNSDVKHMHFITLRIKEAERVIDGAHEFQVGRKQLIEVWMTEAQFAQMITQPNQGDGVACTIRDCQGDQDYGERFGRPMPPEPERFTEKYKRELGATGKLVSDSICDAETVLKQILDGTLKPTKANLGAVAGKLYTAKMNANANLPFVVESMQEDVEKRMAKAAIEFESYVSQSLQARGLAHLQEDAPRLAAQFDPKKLGDGETKEQ